MGSVIAKLFHNMLVSHNLNSLKYKSFNSGRSQREEKPPRRKPLTRAGEAIRNLMERAAGMRHPHYKRVRKRQ